MQTAQYHSTAHSMGLHAECKTWTPLYITMQHSISHVFKHTTEHNCVKQYDALK